MGRHLANIADATYRIRTDAHLCRFCGTPLAESAPKSARFCSPECRTKQGRWTAGNWPHHCVWCHGEIDFETHRGDAIYCSTLCQSRATKRARTSASPDNKWQRRRAGEEEYPIKFLLAERKRRIKLAQSQGREDTLRITTHGDPDTDQGSSGSGE